MKKPEKKEAAMKHDVEVLRVKQFDNGNVICDLKINDVKIYGCRIVEGKKGDFVGFPVIITLMHSVSCRMMNRRQLSASVKKCLIK